MTHTTLANQVEKHDSSTAKSIRLSNFVLPEDRIKEQVVQVEPTTNALYDASWVTQLGKPLPPPTTATYRLVSLP